MRTRNWNKTLNGNEMDDHSYLFSYFTAYNGAKENGWMKDEIHYNQTALNHIGSIAAKQVALKEKK